MPPVGAIKSFDVSKVNLRLKRHQCNEMKNEFNFVLGCDSANAHVISYVNSNTGGVVDIVDGTTITATDSD